MDDLTPNNILIIPIKDKILVFDPESDPSLGLGAQIGGLGGRSAKAVSDAINQDGSINPDSLPDTLFDTSVDTLDDVIDGELYAKTLATSLSEGVVLLSAVSGTLDDILDGETYAKVLLADLSGGHIILGNTVGDLDDIADGTNYSKVLATDISAGHILLAEATGDIDDIADGTSYGKVLLTDLSAGHILLSETVGDLDDVADGTNYAKVASTSVSAGKIVVAGLDSGVTARLFTNSDTKVNVEAWKHASDVTLIDGGKIYTGSITALGIVTAGAFICSTEGYIRGGQTAYNTGTGFFLGYDTDAYKLSIGNPSGYYFNWDGINLTLNGLMPKVTSFTASDNLKTSADTERWTTSTSYVEKKKIYVGWGGTIRVKFDLKTTLEGYVAWGQIYVNGVAKGVERTTESMTYTTYSEDFTVQAGDFISLYIKTGESREAYIRNFRAYYDRLTLDDVAVKTD